MTDWVAFLSGDDGDNPRAVWMQPSIEDKVGPTHWQTHRPRLKRCVGKRMWVMGEDYKVANTHTHTLTYECVCTAPALILPARTWWTDRERGGGEKVKWQGDSKMRVLRQHTHTHTHGHTRTWTRTHTRNNNHTIPSTLHTVYWEHLTRKHSSHGKEKEFQHVSNLLAVSYIN